jgi:hypothetical protein
MTAHAKPRKPAKQPARKHPATPAEPITSTASITAGLSPEAANWFRLLEFDFSVTDPAGRLLLRHALESWDRMREARAAIARDGLTVTCGNGRPIQHPMLAVERDAGSAFRAAMRALNFDATEPNPPGRPPFLVTPRL